MNVENNKEAVIFILEDPDNFHNHCFGFSSCILAALYLSDRIPLKADEREGMEDGRRAH